MPKNLFLKIVSIFVALIFSTNQIVFSQPSAFPVSEIKIPTVFRPEIPQTLGKIDALHAGNGPVIFHIQESHSDFSSQQSVQNILHHLKKAYGVDLVLVEGSAFKLHPEQARFFPKDPDRNKTFLDELLKQGLASGVELFLANEKSAEGYGIEDLRAYRENSKQMVKALEGRERADEFLRKMRTNLEELCVGARLIAPLRIFLKREESFRLDRVPLETWLEELRKTALKHLKLDVADIRNQIDWPMLVRVFKIRELESSLSSRTAEGRSGIHSWIPGQARNDTNALIQILLSELKPDLLFQEIEDLSALIKNKLAETLRQKKIVRLFENYWLLKKLFSLQLTAGEYEAITNKSGIRSWELGGRQTNNGDSLLSFLFPISYLLSPISYLLPHPASPIDSLFTAPLEFYRGAQARDSQMLENIERILQKTGRTKAAVVTGGFHTEPFRKYFEQRNYSYALITPKIENFGGEEQYQNLMLRHSVFKSTHKNAPLILNTRSELRALGKNPALVAADIRRALARFHRLNPFTAVRSEMRITEDDAIHAMEALWQTPDFSRGIPAEAIAKKLGISEGREAVEAALDQLVEKGVLASFVTSVTIPKDHPDAQTLNGLSRRLSEEQIGAIEAREAEKRIYRRHGGTHYLFGPKDLDKRVFPATAAREIAADPNKITQFADALARFLRDSVHFTILTAYRIFQYELEEIAPLQIRQLFEEFNRKHHSIRRDIPYKVQVEKFDLEAAQNFILRTVERLDSMVETVDSIRQSYGFGAFKNIPLGKSAELARFGQYLEVGYLHLVLVNRAYQALADAITEVRSEPSAGSGSAPPQPRSEMRSASLSEGEQKVDVGPTPSSQERLTGSRQDVLQNLEQLKQADRRLTPGDIHFLEQVAHRFELTWFRWGELEEGALRERILPSLIFIVSEFDPEKYRTKDEEEKKKAQAIARSLYQDRGDLAHLLGHGSLPYTYLENLNQFFSPSSLFETAPGVLENLLEEGPLLRSRNETLSRIIYWVDPTSSLEASSWFLEALRDLIERQYQYNQKVRTLIKKAAGVREDIKRFVSRFFYLDITSRTLAEQQYLLTQSSQGAWDSLLSGKMGFSILEAFRIAAGEPEEMGSARIDFEGDESLTLPRVFLSNAMSIFLNLLGNAVAAASPDRELRIRVSVRGREEGGKKFTEIKVGDNGTGISEALLEKIRRREPFTTKGNQGSGEGLQSVRGNLRVLGGELFVESKEGEGTTFTLLIPNRSEMRRDEERESRASVPRQKPRGEMRRGDHLSPREQVIQGVEAGLERIQQRIQEVREELKAKGENRPVFLFIGGDSGAGKTNFSKMFEDPNGGTLIFEPENMDVEDAWEEDQVFIPGIWQHPLLWPKAIWTMLSSSRSLTNAFERLIDFVEPRTGEKFWYFLAEVIKQRLRNLTGRRQIRLVVIDSYQVWRFAGKGIPVDIAVRLEADRETRIANVKKRARSKVETEDSEHWVDRRGTERPIAGFYDFVIDTSRPAITPSQDRNVRARLFRSKLEGVKFRWGQDTNGVWILPLGVEPSNENKIYLSDGGGNFLSAEAASKLTWIGAVSDIIYEFGLFEARSGTTKEIEVLDLSGQKYVLDLSDPSSVELRLNHILDIYRWHQQQNLGVLQAVIESLSKIAPDDLTASSKELIRLRGVNPFLQEIDLPDSSPRYAKEVQSLFQLVVYAAKQGHAGYLGSLAGYAQEYLDGREKGLLDSLSKHRLHFPRSEMRRSRDNSISPQITHSINFETVKMGMPWNSRRTSKSESPVIIASALPLTAAASRKSSLGSRETGRDRGFGVTKIDSRLIQLSREQISSGEKLNFGLWRTSVSSAIWAGEIISRIFSLLMSWASAVKDLEPSRMETSRLVSRTTLRTLIPFLAYFLYDFGDFLIRDRVSFEPSGQLLNQIIPLFLAGLLFKLGDQPEFLQPVQFFNQEPNLAKRFSRLFHGIFSPSFRPNHTSLFSLNQASNSPASPAGGRSELRYKLTSDAQALINKYRQMQVHPRDRMLIDRMVRDYDFRSRDDHYAPSPKVWFLWAVTWAQMAMARAKQYGLTNRTVLLARDARKIEPELIEALAAGLTYSGLDVVYIAQELPNAATSYAWAVRQINPLLSIFLTSSHVADTGEVRGAKVSVQDRDGKLTSLNTNEIKQESYQLVTGLMADDHKVEAFRAWEAGRIRFEDIDENAIRMSSLVGKAGQMATEDINLYRLARAFEEGKPALQVLTEWEEKISLTGREQILRPLKGIQIAVEGSHTPSGFLARRTLEDLGATVISLHEDIQEISGLHKADPSKQENLNDLLSVMQERGIKIGLAFDLDGDRGAIVIQKENGIFNILPPDNLEVMLIPFLVSKGGYDPQKIGKVAVIRDVLSTEGVDDQAAKNRISSYQTDAGYVFLKAKGKELKAQGYTIPMMGERSGHAWLDVTGDYENPIAVAVLFMVMAVEYGKTHPESQNIFEDAAEFYSVPYRQSLRFQPPFQPALLKLLEGDRRNQEIGFHYEPGVKPDSRIVALGRDHVIREMLNRFEAGQKFETPAGELTVSEIQTTVGDDGLYRFADMHFKDNREQSAGRFVLRASANDPTFVASYETRVREAEGETLDIPKVEERYAAISEIVFDWLEERGFAFIRTDPHLVPDANTRHEAQSYHKHKTHVTRRSELRSDEEIQRDNMEKLIRAQGGEWEKIKESGFFAFNMQKTLVARREIATEKMLELLDWLLSEGIRIVIISTNSGLDVQQEVIEPLKNFLAREKTTHRISQVTVYTDGGTSKYRFDLNGNWIADEAYQSQFFLPKELEAVIAQALKELGTRRFFLEEGDKAGFLEAYERDRKKHGNITSYQFPWFEGTTYEPDIVEKLEVAGTLEAPFIVKKKPISLGGTSPDFSEHVISYGITKFLPKQRSRLVQFLRDYIQTKLGSESADIIFRTGGESTIDVLSARAGKAVALADFVESERASGRPVDLKYGFYHGDEVRRLPERGNDMDVLDFDFEGDPEYRRLRVVALNPENPQGLTDEEQERLTYVGGEQNGTRAYLEELRAHIQTLYSRRSELRAQVISREEIEQIGTSEEKAAQFLTKLSESIHVGKTSTPEELELFSAVISVVVGAIFENKIQTPALAQKDSIQSVELVSSADSKRWDKGWDFLTLKLVSGASGTDYYHFVYDKDEKFTLYLFRESRQGAPFFQALWQEVQKPLSDLEFDNDLKVEVFSVNPAEFLKIPTELRRRIKSRFQVPVRAMNLNGIRISPFPADNHSLINVIIQSPHEMIAEPAEVPPPAEDEPIEAAPATVPEPQPEEVKQPEIAKPIQEAPAIPSAEPQAPQPQPAPVQPKFLSIKEIKETLRNLLRKYNQVLQQEIPEVRTEVARLRESLKHHLSQLETKLKPNDARVMEQVLKHLETVLGAADPAQETIRISFSPVINQIAAPGDEEFLSHPKIGLDLAFPVEFGSGDKRTVFFISKLRSDDMEAGFELLFRTLQSQNVSYASTLLFPQTPVGKQGTFRIEAGGKRFDLSAPPPVSPPEASAWASPGKMAKDLRSLVEKALHESRGSLTAMRFPIADGPAIEAILKPLRGEETGLSELRLRSELRVEKSFQKIVSQFLSNSEFRRFYEDKDKVVIDAKELDRALHAQNEPRVLKLSEHLAKMDQEHVAEEGQFDGAEWQSLLENKNGGIYLLIDMSAETSADPIMGYLTLSLEPSSGKGVIDSLFSVENSDEHKTLLFDAAMQHFIQYGINTAEWEDQVDHTFYLQYLADHADSYKIQNKGYRTYRYELSLSGFHPKHHGPEKSSWDRFRWGRRYFQTLGFYAGALGLTSAGSYFVLQAGKWTSGSIMSLITAAISSLLVLKFYHATKMNAEDMNNIIAVGLFHHLFAAVSFFGGIGFGILGWILIGKGYEIAALFSFGAVGWNAYLVQLANAHLRMMEKGEEIVVRKGKTEDSIPNDRLRPEASNDSGRSELRISFAREALPNKITYTIGPGPKMEPGQSTEEVLNYVLKLRRRGKSIFHYSNHDLGVTDLSKVMDANARTRIDEVRDRIFQIEASVARLVEKNIVRRTQYASSLDELDSEMKLVFIRDFTVQVVYTAKTVELYLEGEKAYEIDRQFPLTKITRTKKLSEMPLSPLEIYDVYVAALGAILPHEKIFERLRTLRPNDRFLYSPEELLSRELSAPSEDDFVEDNTPLLQAAIFGNDGAFSGKKNLDFLQSFFQTTLTEIDPRFRVLGFFDGGDALKLVFMLLDRLGRPDLKSKVRLRFTGDSPPGSKITLNGKAVWEFQPNFSKLQGRIYFMEGLAYTAQGQKGREPHPMHEPEIKGPGFENGLRKFWRAFSPRRSELRFQPIHSVPGTEVLISPEDFEERGRILPYGYFEKYSLVQLVEILSKLLGEPVYSRKAGILPKEPEEILPKVIGDANVVVIPSVARDDTFGQSHGHVVFDAGWASTLIHTNPKALLVILASLSNVRQSIAFIGNENLYTEMRRALLGIYRSLNHEERVLAEPFLARDLKNIKAVVKVIPPQELSQFVRENRFGVVTLLSETNSALEAQNPGANFILRPSGIHPNDLPGVPLLVHGLSQGGQALRDLPLIEAERIRRLQELPEIHFWARNKNGRFEISYAEYLQHVFQADQVMSQAA